ncbi:PREDICTED: uncharacterized protein LOC105565284 [Vollenhovia emeryi]|uniref:uncharacterized protein LOC105565284 n=1 Tax=Vollenhovia emeryi TaxID=411798 RepID=UPI0005F4C8A2|nr:PREDICTED: uncharacterized protein LOC105565284 [Vollenhovia emeryi]
MPQIMTEAFARGLLDKIMIQVLDVVDRDAEDGKSWEQHVNEETGDARSEHMHGRSRANERPHINYSKTEEIELIAKIVRDLRDIRIGDSRYVLPPSLLTLEKQVKYDDAPLASPTTDVAETQHTTRGQGDTHQIVHATVLESPIELTESVKTIRKKKEGEAANEATSVSVGLLQQLIGDLEDKTASVCCEDDAPLDSISEEHIAVCEEKEEQFIRTIEVNAGDTHDIATGTLRSSESVGRFRVTELKHDEKLRSRSSQHVASTSREVGLEEEEVQIEKRGSNSLSSLKPSRDDSVATVDQILPVNDAEKRKTSNEATTKKKKRGLGSRLRKLLRAAFGRRKN